MNPDQLQELQVKLRQLKTASKKIRENNFTRKTTGGKYPIGVGYATAVRRPVQDILKWISRVEQMLKIIIEEAEA